MDDTTKPQEDRKGQEERELNALKGRKKRPDLVRDPDEIVGTPTDGS